MVRLHYVYTCLDLRNDALEPNHARQLIQAGPERSWREFLLRYTASERVSIMNGMIKEMEIKTWIETDRRLFEIGSDSTIFFQFTPARRQESTAYAAGEDDLGQQYQPRQPTAESPTGEPGFTVGPFQGGGRRLVGSSAGLNYGALCCYAGIQRLNAYRS